MRQGNQTGLDAHHRPIRWLLSFWHNSDPSLLDLEVEWADDAIASGHSGQEFEWTDEVDEITSKGRHSTTARELIVLPGAGILIDNPGIREGSDAGCASRAVLAAGKLDRARFEGFEKLEAEIEKLRASRKKRQMTGDRHLRRIQQSKSRKHAERHDPDREYERIVR